MWVTMVNNSSHRYTAHCRTPLALLRMGCQGYKPGKPHEPLSEAHRAHCRTRAKRIFRLGGPPAHGRRPRTPAAAHACTGRPHAGRRPRTHAAAHTSRRPRRPPARSPATGRRPPMCSRPRRLPFNQARMQPLHVRMLPPTYVCSRPRPRTHTQAGPPARRPPPAHASRRPRMQSPAHARMLPMASSTCGVNRSLRMCCSTMGSGRRRPTRYPPAHRSTAAGPLLGAADASRSSSCTLGGGAATTKPEATKRDGSSCVWPEQRALHCRRAGGRGATRPRRPGAMQHIIARALQAR